MDQLKEPRGVKRPPEDDLDSEQRLAKRLSSLDLGLYSVAHQLRLDNWANLSRTQCRSQLSHHGAIIV
jgi:hypothetical protein